MSFKKRKLLLEKITDILPIAGECYKEVLQFFRDNEKKSVNWFYIQNPSLGKVRPIEMLLRGKAEKLLNFIKDYKK